MVASVSEGLDRRLVAVMFTDMVGYTALLQADERLGIEKRELYIAALDRHHDAFGGTVVQRLGDGSMSMFPSSLAAVQAAVAIQQELARQEVPVRIGIHMGEVIVEPERLTGDAVNVAARVESFAVPGSVFVSDAVYEQIKARPKSAWLPWAPSGSRTSAGRSTSTRSQAPASRCRTGRRSRGKARSSSRSAPRCLSRARRSSAATMSSRSSPTSSTGTGS